MFERIEERIRNLSRGERAEVARHLVSRLDADVDTETGEPEDAYLARWWRYRDELDAMTGGADETQATSFLVSEIDGIIAAGFGRQMRWVLRALGLGEWKRAATDKEADGG